MTAKNGDTVRVHYRGVLDDGREFDSSTGRQPMEFKLGEGAVIPGFESAVLGLEAGESTIVRIEAEDAYGARIEDAVKIVPRDMFLGDPAPDREIDIVAPDGDTLRARITATEGEQVTLDFNHPLAGEALTYEIQLVEIVQTD